MRLRLNQAKGANVIYGLGTDAISIARVRNAVQKWGERFLSRVFTPIERAFCEASRDAFPHYAVRFAAKEAVAKALGKGFRFGIQFKDIEVQSDPFGRPTILLHGGVAEFARKEGIQTLHLSLSHAEEIGVATAIAEYKK